MRDIIVFCLRFVLIVMMVVVFCVGVVFLVWWGGRCFCLFFLIVNC